MADNVKILVADDASFMRTVLKDILKSNGLASDIIEILESRLRFIIFICFLFKDIMYHVIFIC